MKPFLLIKLFSRHICPPNDKKCEILPSKSGVHNSGVFSCEVLFWYIGSCSLRFTLLVWIFYVKYIRIVKNTKWNKHGGIWHTDSISGIDFFHGYVVHYPLTKGWNALWKNTRFSTHYLLVSLSILSFFVVYTFFAVTEIDYFSWGIAHRFFCSIFSVEFKQ